MIVSTCCSQYSFALFILFVAIVRTTATTNRKAMNIGTASAAALRLLSVASDPSQLTQLSVTPSLVG